MKRSFSQKLLSNRLCLSLLALGGVWNVTGSAFQDLDFERPGLPSVSPDGIWLSWSLAAPGWSHPQGGDSTFVYHKTPPNDHVGQFYFLADSASTQWPSLQGECSLVLVSGHYNRNDANSPWVNAFIEQQGVIPEYTSSFQFMAAGDFSLLVNANPVPVTSLGGYLYGADLSAYAGKSVDLRIMNTATELQRPLILDALSFSAQPVPEPSSLGLLALGGIAWAWNRRLSKRE